MSFFDQYMENLIDDESVAINEAKEESAGVFWLIDGNLLAFPFFEDQYAGGVAKTGTTYNHKKLWPDIKPRGNNKPYNYYPRGRVAFSGKGVPIIYMNPNIEESEIPNIKREFGLRSEPKISYDHSDHYKCHLDDDWKVDY